MDKSRWAVFIQLSCSFSASAGANWSWDQGFGGMCRGRGVWDWLHEQSPEWLHNKYTQLKRSRSFKKQKRKKLFTSQRTSVAISCSCLVPLRLVQQNTSNKWWCSSHRGEERRGEVVGNIWWGEDQRKEKLWDDAQRSRDEVKAVESASYGLILFSCHLENIQWSVHAAAPSMPLTVLIGTRDRRPNREINSLSLSSGGQ